MRLAELIVKRSLVVLALWIILGVVSTPALLRLGEATEYRAEKLLPSGAESVRAIREVLGIGGRDVLTEQHIVLIRGVDVLDQRLVDIDYKVSESLKNYALYYGSPYTTIRRLYSEVDRKLRQEVNTVYSYANSTYHTLKALSANRDLLINQLSLLYNNTQVLRRYYEDICINWDTYNKLAVEVYNNLSLLPLVLVNLSKVYSNTVEQVRGVRDTAMYLEKIVVATDIFYSSLLGNLSKIYDTMSQLNSTLYTINKLYYEGSRYYIKVLFDVMRVHYYLLYNTTAYEKGLNMQVVESVVRYTAASGYPVDPQLVTAVYSYTSRLYSLGGVDEAVLYAVASRIYLDLLTYAGVPQDALTLSSLFLYTYNTTLLSASLQMLSMLNTNYAKILLSHPIEGQLKLLNHLQNASAKALPLAVQLYADYASLAIADALGLPRDMRTTISSILVEVYEAGYPLDRGKLREPVINTTYATMVSLNVHVPQRTTVYVLNKLYELGPVKSIAVEAVYQFLDEVFLEMPAKTKHLVAGTVIDIDPEGLQVIAYNKTLALYATSRILSEMTSISQEVLHKVIVGVVDEYQATYEILKQRFVALGYRAYLPILGVIHENRGLLTYDVFRELVKQMLFSVLTEVSRKTLGVEATSLDVAVGFIADRLAYTMWSGNITIEYVYRLIVGAPIAIAAISTASSIDIIDSVLLDAPLVNAVVVDRCEVDSKEVAVDTIGYLAKLSSIADTVVGIPGVSVESIAEQLIKIPLNATRIDLVKALTYSIGEKFTEIGLNITTEDIQRTLLGILIDNLEPLSIVVELATRYTPPIVDVKMFSQYLGISLEKEDPGILYEALREHVHRKVFSEAIESLRGLMVSEDNTSFLVVVIPAGRTSAERASNAQKVVEVIRSTLAESGYASVGVSIVSSDVLESEVKEYMSRDIERVNRVSAIASVVIAFAVIGGVVATALPFIGIAISLAVSHGLMYLLASANIITVTSWSRVLAMTTALGLGMNYSSYIVTRFREVYPELRDPRKAAYEAVKYALPAIAASSSTDIIGFAVMRLAWEFPLIASLGETVPIAIAVVLAVSLTLTPALLALFGDKKWFWWPHKLEARKIGRSIKFKLTPPRAVAMLITSVIVLGIGVVGFLGFRGSHDYGVFMPEGSPTYQAYLELKEAFPVGKLMPIYVVCRLRDGYSAHDLYIVENVKTLQSTLLGVKGVAEVYSYVNPGDRPRELYVSKDNKTFYLEVIVKPSPLSREGVDLTRELRDLAKKEATEYCQEVLIGGFSASSLEIEEMLDRVFWSRVVPAAIVLMVVSMSLSFQSLLSGPIAMLSIVIGYFAGVAIATFVASAYNQPLLWFLPLITLPAVLGVGLDYNSYYMNRQRYELLNGRSSYEASSIAVEKVSHVVLGLGLIVTATYASLITGSSWGIRELGIALSTAVLITTILASYILTPALLAVLGRKTWWPGVKRLDKKWLEKE